jgi:L-amino acid N-acyltransferase YncA
MLKMDIKIEKMLPEDWVEVAQIYAEGMATGNATFQKEVPNWTTWDGEHLPYGRLIARKMGKNEVYTDLSRDYREGSPILGWAALTAVSGRCVYAGVAELSVYVAASARGQGIGKLLMDNLIKEAETNGLWTLQAGIFPENIGNVQLHLKMGFRQIGYREKVGQMDGIWRDTLLFERRSSVVGV